MDMGAMTIRITNTGEERCAPQHQYGPAVRGCYLIHYAVSGRGQYIARGHTWEVHACQGFLIAPGDVTTYRADAFDPWHYLWIGYAGSGSAELTRMAGLDPARPVFDAPDVDAMAELMRAADQDVRALRLGDLGALGCLMRIMARIGQFNAPRPTDPRRGVLMEYFGKATWFIEGNLSQGVTVDEVAAYVGLCRSQLYRVFMAADGASPQQWIQHARLRRARELLLSQPALTLSEVAASAGYSGAPQMADAFRRFEHTSPREFRREGRSDLHGV